MAALANTRQDLSVHLIVGKECKLINGDDAKQLVDSITNQLAPSATRMEVQHVSHVDRELGQTWGQLTAASLAQPGDKDSGAVATTAFKTAMAPLKSELSCETCSFLVQLPKFTTKSHLASFNAIAFFKMHCNHEQTVASINIV